MNMPASLLSINATPVDAHWSKSTWFVWLILPIICIELVLIAGFAYADGFERAGYTSLQTPWFIYLNDALAFLPDIVWLNMTYLGDGVVIFALFSIMLIIRAQAWAAMFASIFFASVMTNLGKSFFSMPRPAVVLDHQSFNIIGETLIGYSSLPSGHSITISFVIISILASMYANPQSKGQIANIVIGLIVLSIFCLSRVAVGAHWPLDVIAGMGCGWIAALIGVSLANYFTHWWQCMLQGKRRFILMGLLLLLSGALLARAFSEIHAAPILIISSLMSLYVSYVLVKFPAFVSHKE